MPTSDETRAEVQRQGRRVLGLHLDDVVHAAGVDLLPGLLVLDAERFLAVVTDDLDHRSAPVDRGDRRAQFQTRGQRPSLRPGQRVQERGAILRRGRGQGADAGQLRLSRRDPGVQERRVVDEERRHAEPGRVAHAEPAPQRPFQAGERILIKPTNTANNIAPLIASVILAASSPIRSYMIVAVQASGRTVMSMGPLVSSPPTSL